MLSRLLVLGCVRVYRQSIPTAALVFDREAAIGELADAVCRLSLDEFGRHVPIGDLLVEPRRLLGVLRRDDVVVQRLADDVLGLIAERLFERLVDAAGDRVAVDVVVCDRRIGNVREQREEVVAFCSAPTIDGGTGALYFLLRFR